MAVVTATNPAGCRAYLYALFRQLRHRAVAGRRSQATTIELAIYQALSYDYDPARAAMLALIQMVCCLGLVLLSQRLSKAIAPGTTLLQGWRDPDDRLHSRICDTVLIVLALLLLLPPLLAVIVDGVNRQLPEVLMQPVLWQALCTRCVLRWRQAYCAWC